MDVGFSIAILSGEMRNRLDFTKAAIDSFNNQTYRNIQKILVNGGSPPHQTNELLDRGAKLDDWTILDFPIDAMDFKSGWTGHRWNGQAALHAAEKNYFFTMNDDDFIAPDFFEKIAIGLTKYPNAGSAMGMGSLYINESSRIKKFPRPKDKNNIDRPELEPGIEVVRKIFFSNKKISDPPYHPCIGFQPVFKTELARDVSDTLFSSGGFPDNSSYFQVVAREHSLFIFDAKFYWRIHSAQDGRTVAKNFFWNLTHKEHLTRFMQSNLYVFSKYFPNNHKDKKNIKKYFKQAIVTESLIAISQFYSISRLIKGKGKSLLIDRPPGANFPLWGHLRIILRHPFLSLRVLKKYH
jgi:glycosyltransferase involved in cell wall biosynthesis